MAATATATNSNSNDNVIVEYEGLDEFFMDEDGAEPKVVERRQDRRSPKQQHHQHPTEPSVGGWERLERLTVAAAAGEKPEDEARPQGETAPG